jgi:hypothetical protein
MLAQLVQKHGVGARVVPNQEVLPANVFRLDCTGVTMVCLSYLEPSGFANARYLVRRLRHRLPRAKILMGLWTRTAADMARFADLEEIGVDFVVTSLSRAVERVVVEAGARACASEPPQAPDRLSA